MRLLFLGLVSVLLILFFPVRSQEIPPGRELLILTNEAREKRGLEPLARDYSLSLQARAHSQRMALTEELAHSDLGYAENVGVGLSAKRLHWLFMLSPLHRRNILDDRWRSAGIGVWEQADRLWVTVLFRV